MASTQIKDKNGTIKDIHDRRLPASLGTAGQALKMNASGAGIEWGDVYEKPSGGIPKTDMASAVQTSLGKADTAEQATNKVTAMTSSSTDTQYPSAKAVYDELSSLKEDKQDKDTAIASYAITNQGITLGAVNTILQSINTNGEHVFFDVSALGVMMYLCTININTTANTYKITDLVLGRIAEGTYDSTKLLTMAMAEASPMATQDQIDYLQEEIDEIGGTERIKNWDILGDLIESGDSTDYIDSGDSIGVNWVNTVLGTTSSGLTVTCSNADTFINEIGEAEAKNYLFIYDGTNWTYGGVTVDLSDYAITVTGTPVTGEAMTIVTTVNTVDYTFTGYDDMDAHNSAVPHNWLLEQKYAPSTKVWDEPEALFTVYNGQSVPAGNYHKRLYCYRSSFDIDLYFTVASAIGDATNKIQLCYNGRLTGQSITNADGVTKTGVSVVSSIIPKVYQTGASAGSAIAVAYTATSGVTYTELDSLNVEGQDPVVYIGSFDKCVYGSNCYDLSDIDNWLNSDDAGDAYVPSHLCDVASSYNRGNGFLWGLDPRVKAIMLDCDIDLIAGYDDKRHTRGDYYEVTRKVFLLSMKEMSFNINTSEGAVTDLYNEYTGGVLTDNACEGRAKYNRAGGTLNSYRWSRSARSNVAYHSYGLTSTGASDYYSAYSSQYFAPAFIIGKASSNS